MSIIYIPRERNPFMQYLPAFLGNLTNQAIAQRAARNRAQEAQRQREEQELRRYKAEGWREAEAQKPVITVGGKGIVPPQQGLEFRKRVVDGQEVVVPVTTQTPYGGTPQITKVGGAIKGVTAKQGKVWVHNPQQKIKRQVSPDEAVQLVSQGGGWVQGQPYGPQSKGFEIYGYDEQGRPLMRMGGTGELTPSAKTTIQKETVGLMDQLNEVTDLESKTYTDALTAQGQLARMGYRLADYLKLPIGKRGAQHLQSSRVFVEKIEQIFNAYRKEITGAQAAMKEISMLRNSILNKKLTPTEFKASLKSYKEKIQRQIRLKRMILSRGLSGQTKSAQQKELNERINNLYMAGGDVDDKEIDRYGDELLEGYKNTYPGITETEAGAMVIQRLRKEGYNI